MSSPYPPGTKKGTEETLVAISRTLKWAARIDTKHDVDGVDVSSFTTELKEERDRLKEKHRTKTTEVAIDNFVFNKPETVETVLFGNLDERVAATSDVQSYINEDFGQVSPPNLSKEEIVWLVAQEVAHHQSSAHSVDAYDESPFADASLSSFGTQPSRWSETYPVYNR